MRENLRRIALLVAIAFAVSTTSAMAALDHFHAEIGIGPPGEQGLLNLANSGGTGYLTPQGLGPWFFYPQPPDPDATEASIFEIRDHEAPWQPKAFLLPVIL